jgi:thiopurine S-methyltransferase
MDTTYWLERWETGNTRFDEPEPHRYLTRFFAQVAPASTNCIFVPLCGKSIDMAWLLQQQQHVIGVEISPIPLQTFIQENQLHPTVTTTAYGTVYQDKHCTLYQSSLFDLSDEIFLPVNLVYDRGALVALPWPELRKQYIQWYQDKLPLGTHVLLISFESDANVSQTSGPPFPITPDELTKQFGTHFSIELLAREYVNDIKPHWRDRGLTQLYECAYCLEKIK